MSVTNFIHTADLRLKEPIEAGIEVLLFILQLTRETDACLLITGNLFDSKQAAESMRDAIWSVFDSLSEIPVLLIPGTRDENCYSHKDWGSSVKVVSQKPFSIADYGGVKVVAVPYSSNSNIPSALKDYTAPEPPSVAMIHGTFLGEGNYHFYKCVKDNRENVIPIYKSDIEMLKCSYIAIGGVQTEFSRFNVGSQIVCYPGSPMSFPDKEVSSLSIVKVSVDLETNFFSCEPIDVIVGGHNIVKKFNMFAGQETKVFEALLLFVKSVANKQASININLEGHTILDWDTIDKKIEDIKHENESNFASFSINNNLRSYMLVFNENHIAKECIEKLNQKENIPDSIRARAVEITLKSFAKTVKNSDFQEEYL
ncbi:MAG: hypothetical protein ABIH42_08475 [Planctomycetota bacterium]